MYAQTNASMLNGYRSQAVMTASPGELIVMLYDALIKNIKLAQMYIETRDIERTSNHLKKAQAIVDALIQALDFDYEISNDLYKLYDFLLDALVKSNTTKDGALLPDVLDIVKQLRDAWNVAKQATANKSYIIEE